MFDDSSLPVAKQGIYAQPFTLQVGVVSGFTTDFPISSMFDEPERGFMTMTIPFWLPAGLGSLQASFLWGITTNLVHRSVLPSGGISGPGDLRVKRLSDS